MEVLLFNNEYYISLDLMRSLMKMSPQQFDLRIDQYEFECKQLLRICPDEEVITPCKSAYALLTWHLTNSYQVDTNLHAIRKELSKYSRKIPKRILSRSLRIEIAFRQRYACNKCILFPIPPDFHVDHIIELQDGGQDVSENLQALCPGCHAEKTRLNRLRKNKMFANAIKKQYESFVPQPYQETPEQPRGKVFSKFFSKNTL
tara:strand:+ start:53421 stop:54029 length:609 start_codon:yes stop_codon:yes gene_type:complete